MIEKVYRKAEHGIVANCDLSLKPKFKMNVPNN